MKILKSYQELGILFEKYFSGYYLDGFAIALYFPKFTLCLFPYLIEYTIMNVMAVAESLYKVEHIVIECDVPLILGCLLDVPCGKITDLFYEIVDVSVHLTFY